MDILRLLAVFAVIVITTRLKKPLWMALAGASIVTGLVFGLPLETFFGSVWGAATSATTPAKSRITVHHCPKKFPS